MKTCLHIKINLSSSTLASLKSKVRRGTRHDRPPLRCFFSSKLAFKGRTLVPEREIIKYADLDKYFTVDPM